MTRTFAMDLIETFLPEEAESFRLFLQSPFFAKGINVEHVSPLFEALYAARQNEGLDNLSKEDLFQSIMPGKKYVEGKVDKLMTDLKRLLEQFLLARRYFSRENEGTRLLDLSTEIRLKRLASRYENAIDKVKKFNQEQAYESLGKLFFEHQIAHEELEWFSLYNRIKNDVNIMHTLNTLEHFYLSKKTWLLNYLIIQYKATALTGDLSALNLETWEVPSNFSGENSLLDIYWQTFQLLRKPVPKESDFYHLLNSLELVEGKLNLDSLRELGAYVRNLCAILVDNGQEHLKEPLFNIYKNHLSKGYFYLNNKISPNAYLAITTIAIGVNEIQWANEFVEFHRNILIDDNETGDFYRLNKAICLFAEKKYEESLDYIPFSSIHPFYHRFARCWELKIYYELQSDLLEFKIDSFKMYLSRSGKKNQNREVLEHYTNFVNYLLQLSQSVNKPPKRSEVLVERIQKNNKVAQRTWLLEKARELGKKKK